MHLDIDQLSNLILSEQDINYCLSTLTQSLSTPDFRAGGFAAHEVLQILINVTHPAHSSEVVKGKDYFDEMFENVAKKLAKNIHDLVSHNLLVILKRMIQEKLFLSLACQLLWNLLHHESIRRKISPEMITLLEQLPASTTTDQLVYCCLRFLGKFDDDQGVYLMQLAWYKPMKNLVSISKNQTM